MSEALKKEIRARVLAAREDCPTQARGEASAVILEKLRKHPRFLNADTVFFYAPIRGEVDTLPLIEDCLRAGRRLALPRTEGADMRFFYLRDVDELKAGRFGVPEPPADEPADDAATALVILPGVAFSENGDRIGYGAGYYDRYLAAHDGHPTIGLAYESQITEGWPVSPTDVRADLVITECREIGA